MNRDAAKWYLKVRAMNGDLNSHGSSTSQVDPYKQYRGKTYKKSIRKLKRKSRKKLCRNLLGKGKIFDFKRKKKCTKAINQYIEDHDITI
jgi:hypothetical protein